MWISAFVLGVHCIVCIGSNHVYIIECIRQGSNLGLQTTMLPFLQLLSNSYRVQKLWL